MNYKLEKDIRTEQISIRRIMDGASIPPDPNNTDYANFKRQINEGTAQLQDADGNPMTAEAAKQFVATLP